jgi:TPR repeat protein
MAWYKRAADASHGVAADYISTMYAIGTGGIARSKRQSMQWCRKAADKGLVDPCLQLAISMYADRPHAREVGHVVEATGVAMSAADMEGHDHIPPDVLTSVVHWLRKVVVAEGQPPSLLDYLEDLRSAALEGARYCVNDGCEFVGLLKDFKVCPRCKISRYCSDACQKQDWTAGEHKAACGTSAQLFYYH